MRRHIPLFKDMVAIHRKLQANLAVSMLVIPAMIVLISITPGNAAAYVLHAPILIDGDSDFLPANGVISGNGTAENPYLIADWEINQSSTTGIHIKNTRAFFSINGVFVHNNALFSSILLENVSNAEIETSDFLDNSGNEIQLMNAWNISVRNCTFQNTGNNVILGNIADNVTIENLAITDADTAIYFEQASNLSISNCSVEDVASSFITMSNCRDSIVQSCLMRNSNFKGIELIFVNSTEFNGNAIVNASWGLFLYGCNILTFHGNMICQSRSSQVELTSSSSIKWNVTYAEGGGNYWSNYLGNDNNGDGIIDLPYTILPGNIDSFPLYQPTLPDNIAPTSSVDIIGDLGDTGWYKSSAIVKINSTDDFSGILNVSYSIDSSPYTKYQGSFLITDSGEHTLKFFATDRMLNNEAVKVIIIRVDSTGPITDFWLQGIAGYDGWYLSPITVFLNATDNESGIASTWYSLDAGTTVMYTGFFIISSEGNHNLAAYSIDEVGNTGQLNLLDLSVDMESPQLTIDQANGTIFTDVTVMVSWEASDLVSGIDHFEISVDGGDFKRLSSMKDSHNVVGLTDGNHLVTLLAIDKAGHITERQLSFEVKAGVLGVLIANIVLLLAILIVAITIVVIVVIWRRSRRSR